MANDVVSRFVELFNAGYQTARPDELLSEAVEFVRPGLAIHAREAYAEYPQETQGGWQDHVAARVLRHGTPNLASRRSMKVFAATVIGLVAYTVASIAFIIYVL